jgi:hypothetical protein
MEHHHSAGQDGEQRQQIGDYEPMLAQPLRRGCIVITHGTDTIEETACGKRPPSDIGWVSRRSSQKVRFFHKDCVFASPSHILLAAISPDD